MPNHVPEIIKQVENGAWFKGKMVLLCSSIGKYLSKRIYQETCNMKGRFLKNLKYYYGCLF